MTTSNARTVEIEFYAEGSEGLVLVRRQVEVKALADVRTAVDRAAYDKATDADIARQWRFGK